LVCECARYLEIAAVKGVERGGRQQHRALSRRRLICEWQGASRPRAKARRAVALHLSCEVNDDREREPVVRGRVRVERPDHCGADVVELGA